MFLDRVKIWVRAGAAVTGRRRSGARRTSPAAAPTAATGAAAAPSYLRVDAGQTTLRDFRYKHHFGARRGGRGERPGGTARPART